MRRVIVSVLTAVLVGASCAPSSGDARAVAVGRESLPVATDSSRAASALPDSSSPRVTVYYFHRTLRCVACLEMEALTRRAMGYFDEEQHQGRVALKVLNVEEPENEHFIDEFGIYFNTIVVAREEGDRVSWKDIGERAWDLAPYPEEFIPFLVNEVAAALLPG